MEKFKTDFRNGFKNSRKNMKPRGAKFWLNIATLVLIAVVLVAARESIEEAVGEVGKANILILLLIIPTQFLSFYAEAEIFFTYLRERGQLKNVSAIEATSMSLEMNFVNHVFPTGGVSGVGYMNWRLGKLGVSAGQATLSQLIKYIIEFGTFFVLLVIALVWTTAGDQVPNWVVAGNVFGITALIFLVVFGGFLISSESRMRSFAAWLTRNVNSIFAKTFGRVSKRKQLMNLEKTEKFFMDFHRDYKAIRKDKKLLLKPIVWSFICNFAEVGMFVVTFCALGYWINPAVLLIAYGAGQLSGMFMITPGGAGALEVIMIGILTASSVEPSVALAGVILTRVILILLTLASGFIVYHKALHKYGKYDVNSRKTGEKSEQKISSFMEKIPDVDEKIIENKGTELSQKCRESSEPKLNFSAPKLDEMNEIDKKFAKKSSMRKRSKLELSKKETEDFAKMNIVDIEIDGDNFHEDV